MGKFGTSSVEKAKQTLAPEVLRAETERQRLNAQDTALLSSTDLSLFKVTLADLSKAGTRIILFDMPVAAEVFETPRYRVLHDRIRQEFKPYTHWLLTVDELEQIETIDGVHLTGASALSFSEKLEKKLELEK